MSRVSRFGAPVLTEAGHIMAGARRTALDVVCVAQLVRVKGQDVLLQAAAALEGVNVAFAGASTDAQFPAPLEH